MHERACPSGKPGHRGGVGGWDSQGFRLYAKSRPFGKGTSQNAVGVTVALPSLLALVHLRRSTYKLGCSSPPASCRPDADRRNGVRPGTGARKRQGAAPQPPRPGGQSARMNGAGAQVKKKKFPRDIYIVR